MEVGSHSQTDPPALPLVESAHGFTRPAHHEIAGYLSFIVLLAASKPMCTFRKGEARTPLPSTTTPVFMGPGTNLGSRKELIYFGVMAKWKDEIESQPCTR